jgi:hypothetical protein
MYEHEVRIFIQEVPMEPFEPTAGSLFRGVLWCDEAVDTYALTGKCTSVDEAMEELVQVLNYTLQQREMGIVISDALTTSLEAHAKAVGNICANTIDTIMAEHEQEYTHKKNKHYNPYYGDHDSLISDEDFLDEMSRGFLG